MSYDEIEEVTVAKTFSEILKFNQNHDSLGRFSSAEGGSASRSFSEIDTDGALKMAREMGQDPEQIDPDDREKMRGYFGTPKSWALNKSLREQAAEGNPPLDVYRETVDALDRNMQPSSRDIKLIRKTDENTIRALGLSSYDSYTGAPQEELSKLVGKVFENSGYSSTSYDMHQSCFSDRPITLAINAPKGTKMLIRPDRWNGGIVPEAEVLLARGTAMKITGVTVDGKGPYGDQIITIECEVLAA